MKLQHERWDSDFPSVTETVDIERAREYALATNDENPRYESGEFAPPVFAVVSTFPALAPVLVKLAPPELMNSIVHGQQDMHFHRPLRPNQQIRTSAEPFNVRTGRSGTSLTIKLSSVDAASAQPCLDQYVSLYVRGIAESRDRGPDKPDHRFPEEARESETITVTTHVDEDQTYRYSKASGDTMPIHLDETLAKSVGLQGIIVHGLCTMAMTGGAVVNLVADGNPARLRRLAVQFANPLFPGDDLTIAIVQAPRLGTYAFEATSSRGDLVVSNGRAELR